MTRVVVVGASSGLGRRIGVGLGQRGAQVALMARRLDRVEEAAKQAGNGAIAIRCDVTDEESCRSAIAEAVGVLGGLDGIVYCPGIGPLRRIENIDAHTWRWTFDTNVLGASLVTAAALPHLKESHGKAIYLSSVSANQTPPWPGMAAYVVTKAALEKLVDAWRQEHPGVGFTRIAVGDSAEANSEFPATWDATDAAEFYPTWLTRNYMPGVLIDVEELVQLVDQLLRVGGTAAIPSVVLSPRPMPNGSNSIEAFAASFGASEPG